MQNTKFRFCNEISQRTAATVHSLKAGCIAFQAGYNEQVFAPKPWKNLAQIRLVVFEKNAKKRTFNSEKWSHWAEG